MTNEAAYPYDVFISYRWVEPDQTWVVNHLKPALKQAGLKVLLDVDDFIPGRSLVREMERAGEEARRAICVISPDYFADDRIASFEEQMLLLNPSAQKSRLIPFIIRPTQMPPRISRLIPVNWTNPLYHQREWKKLLQVLGAQNQEAAPPPGLPQGERQEPPPIPPGPVPVPPKPIRYTPVIILLAVALVLGLAFYLYPRSAAPKNIEGKIYFQPEKPGGALIPVRDVVVYLSQKSDLQSKPTGADGKFVIPDVPPELQGTQLTAKLGTQEFPPMSYRETGDYAIIPRPAEQPRDIQPINEPWREVSGTDNCGPVDPGQFPYIKQYVLETKLPAVQDRREALVTIELRTAGEAELVSPYVISPARNTGLYQNVTVPDQSRHLAHTWLFEIPQNGLDIKLGVCIGSKVSAAAVSADHLQIYRELE